MTVGRQEPLAQRVLRALADATSASGAAEAVLREIAEHLGARLAILWLRDDAGLLTWFEDWSRGGEVDAFRDVSRRLSFVSGLGLPGRVAATGQRTLIADLAAAEPDFPRAARAAQAGLRSGVATPVPGIEAPLGVLEAFWGDGPPESPSALDDLDVAARQLGTYLDRVAVQQRLRASEERSAAIVAAALDCIVTMDHEGRVLGFNPAAEAVFGYSSEEATGKPLADLIVPPDLRDAHRQAVERYLETRRPRILNRRLELTGLRADGSTFPVELTVTRLGSSEPPLFAGFLRDITERHTAETERDRLLMEAVTSRAMAEAARERSAAAQQLAESARAEAELAGMRLSLLAQAGERMLAARDYEETMQQVVELAVPAIADWCAVTVSQRTGELRTVAVAHDHPARLAAARDLLARYPIAADAPIGAAAVIRTGRTELIEPFTSEHLQRLARDPRHLELLSALAPRAVLTVPLRSPHRVFGALTLAMTESGRAFAPEDVSMAESLGARAALAIENARLFAERSHIAHTLQRGLLPAGVPAIAGLDLAVRYRAAGEANLVGGDFYDVFPSIGGDWTAVLGDVSGKGPEAAVLTALTRHTLRAGALREGSPMANLRLLNEALLASHSTASTRFATVIQARIRPDEQGALITASAGGHLPPLVLRAGGILESVVLSGTLLGAVEDVELSEVDVRLRAGDMMLLFTDGVTELRPQDPAYGEALLRRTLLDHAGASAEEVVAAVEHAAVEAQEGEPRDDIALIAIRATPD